MFSAVLQDSLGVNEKRKTFQKAVPQNVSHFKRFYAECKIYKSGFEHWQDFWTIAAKSSLINLNRRRNKRFDSVSQRAKNSLVFRAFWSKIIVYFEIFSLSVNSNLTAFSFVTTLILGCRRRSNVKNNYCCRAFCVGWSRIT